MINHSLMRLSFSVVSLSLLLSACQPTTHTPQQAADSTTAQSVAQLDYYRPAQQLGELFETVQMQQVFDDSKTFVDSRPKHAPADILRSYRSSKNDARFSLPTFVRQNFHLPSEVGKNFQLDPTLSMEEHIHNHWSYLTREADAAERWSSLIPLPRAYVVPGGRFREIYYWDSYFTMHGLAVSGKLDLMENMLNNFAWLIDQVGHIPNGNRSYYLSRSQPPFFAAMVSLFQQHEGGMAATAFLPQLEKEYLFWMNGADKLPPGQAYRRVVRMNDGSLLNRYYDDLDSPRPESFREDVLTARSLAPSERPRVYRDIRAAAESGWDFSSRWLGDSDTLASIQTTQIVPIDLNSLLYHLERVISDLHALADNQDKARAFAKKALARKQAINQWLWNEQSRAYADYHIGNDRFTQVLSLAMAFPLYFNIAPEDRGNAVADQLRDTFLMPGGLVTTVNRTGEQWDYPNGWAPLQWIAIKGLRDYGHSQLSDEIASRWLNLNRKVFNETGRMMEKYNVVDTTLRAGGGEYPLQDGFGWTNGVVLAITNDQETIE